MATEDVDDDASGATAKFKDDLALIISILGDGTCQNLDDILEAEVLATAERPSVCGSILSITRHSPVAGT